ncbi:hypothetical protein [Enemella sp. A6]|uniref:hypothetical protein n=1 Tax=Enemella sp. A6 TaxID=3440152 RepID=UPI003EBE6DFB
MKKDISAVVVGLICLMTCLGLILGPPRSIVTIAVPLGLIAIGLTGLFLVPGKSNTPRKEA